MCSNSLTTLPDSLSFLTEVYDLNLADNQFASDSVLVDPHKLMSSILDMPKLRKLNLSRNKV